MLRKRLRANERTEKKVQFTKKTKSGKEILLEVIKKLKEISLNIPSLPTGIRRMS